MNPVDSLKAVLCGQDGKCCIAGSDADRKVVDEALAALATAREYMTSYSDCKEWAQPSQALELSEAIENLIDATEGLMTWQVKNVKVWNNGAYDTAHMRVEQLRAAINAKERAAHGIKQGGQQ